MCRMADTSWVDLLADKTTNGRHIQITDNTPQREQRSRGEERRSSEAHVLRCQVASLLKDKHRLAQDALKSRESNVLFEQELCELRMQLKDSRRQSEEVCLVLEEQSKLISELSEFKTTCGESGSVSELSQAQDTIRALEQSVCEKDRALEGVYAHVQELRSEVSRLSQHLHSPPPHNSQLNNVERLTLRNAEVSENLLATQHSRTLLEKELLSLKQRLSEETACRQQLEQTLQDDSKELLTLREAELSRVQMELQHLKDSQLTSIDAKCQEVDKLRAQIEQQLKLEQLDRVRLEGELMAERQDRVRLEGELMAERQDRVRLEGELTAERQDRVRLEGELTAERQDRVRLEGELTAERQDRVRLEGELTAERQDRVRLARSEEKLTQQLSSQKILLGEMTKEREKLSERVRQFEQQNLAQTAVFEKVKDQLESTSRELGTMANELEITKTDKMILKQQVCDLEAQLESVKSQLASRAQLTAEMKTLLDQRALRVKQLEKSLDHRREELSISMETAGDLLNASKESLGSEFSVSSIVSTSSRRSPARFSTAQAEIAHLKQRLAESRQSSIRLEVQCARLRTEGARLLGSQQALLAIREQLLAENSSLDKGQRSFRETWEREKNDMSSQIGLLQNELNKTRELVSARNNDSMRVVTMETKLNQSRQEIANLQSDLSHVTLDWEHVTVQLSHMTSLVDSESGFLNSTTEIVVSDIVALSTQDGQVKERAALTQAINNKRRSQIQEREEGVSRLLAELEVLRVRKKVFLTHISSFDESDVQAVLRLKARLRRERQQTNFVRLRLGYVLGELRLYKQLKVAMETRVHEMEHSLENLQHQHFLCVEKLRQAELLGFTIS